MSGKHMVQVTPGKVRAIGQLLLNEGHLNVGEEKLSTMILKAAGQEGDSAPFVAFGRCRILVELLDVTP